MPSMEWWNELFAAIDTKDTKKFLSYLAADGEFVFGNAPAAVGHADIGAAVSGFLGTIRRSEHRMTRAWEDATSAACEGLVTYTRLDGSTVALPFVDVFHFRGGKIGRYQIYMDVNPLFAGG